MSRQALPVHSPCQAVPPAYLSHDQGSIIAACPVLKPHSKNAAFDAQQGLGYHL